MKFSDLRLLDIGDTIQLAGAVFQGNGCTYLFMSPGKAEEGELRVVEMTAADWKQCLEQSDLVRVEVTADDGVSKAIVRKCERAIDAGLAWNVYRRDSFSCRYCGAQDLPLTVDHLVRWEEGGPTIPENLLSSCKRCNRKRGRMEYADWLKSRTYLELSRGLSREVIIANEQIAATLPGIKRVKVIRSR